MNEPTADEIMKMFAVDIAVLRRGRRKPSEKPPVGKKKAKASKKPVKLTAEQLARKREHTRQWRMAHREQVLEYNRRYKLAHRPTFHRFAVRVPPPLGAGRNHSFLFSILRVMWYY